MPICPETLAHDALAAARRAGADAADALVVESTALAIEVREGVLEHAERSEGAEIGLRVILGGRQASVSASDLSARTLEEMAARAVAMAREAPADPTVGLADPAQLIAPDEIARRIAALDLLDPAGLPAPDALQEAARAAEAAALGVAGVAQVQGASASASRMHMHLAASNGFSGGYTRSGHALSCVAISGEGTGMEREHAYESRVYAADLPDAGELGALAGARAAARAGARRPPTGAVPVLYDERVAGSLIGHLLAAINGTAIMRGASWARGLLGEPVLPGALSLLSTPLRARMGGARPFDAEGLPTAERALVEGGVLQGWVLDLATARKLGLESTADARRSPGAPPSPGAGAVALTQGTASRADLIADMGTGLLVTQLLGSTINPNTGDYSRGAAGFWVENGAIAYPVNECTIAGSLPDMLRRIVPANDADPHRASQVPSLLVEGLTVAGA